jgi:hypothetical protein
VAGKLFKARTRKEVNSKNPSFCSINKRQLKDGVSRSKMITGVTTYVYAGDCDGTVFTSFTGAPKDDASGEQYVMTGTYAIPYVDYRAIARDDPDRSESYCVRKDIEYNGCVLSTTTITVLRSSLNI